MIYMCINMAPAQNIELIQKSMIAITWVPLNFEMWS